MVKRADVIALRSFWHPFFIKLTAGPSALKKHSDRWSGILLLNILAGLLYCGPALARPYVTSVQCGNLKSEIIQDCSVDGRSTCKTQKWVLDEKTIEFDPDWPVAAFACMPIDGAQRIVFYVGNGGNCPECERFDIWTLQGKHLSTKYNKDNIFGFSSRNFKYLNGPKRLESPPHFEFIRD